MLRILPILLLPFFGLMAFGQNETRLPADLRQHNLTTYNASLFNPAFSLDRNNPQSLALWTRWQWQAIDSDPTTMFLNYTRRLNDKSAAGAAFFQQNTGVFFNTGGALNYAYELDLNSSVKVAFGLNMFAFKQSLADDRFQTDPNVPLPLPAVADDFILQMAPGVRLSVERLTLSLASENLFDYNFTANERNTEKADKIFMSLLSYDFPVTLGAARNSFLRPSMYLRTIPGQSNQVGFYTLLNTNKYWGQVGYNNFYGYGVGLGGTFFKHLSLGALVEFGTGSSISTESSFELVMAYFLGKPDERHKIVGFDIEEENPLLELEEEKEGQEKTEEELEETQEVVLDEKATEKSAKEEGRQQRKREKAVQDSIAKVEKEAKLAAKELQKQLAKEAKEQAKKEEGIVEAEEKAQQETIEEETEKGEETTVDTKAAEKLAKEEEKQQRKQEKAVKDSIAKVEKDAEMAAKEIQRRLEKEAKEQAKKEEALAEAEVKEQKRKKEVDEKVREDLQTLKTDSIDQAKKDEVSAEAEKALQKRKQDSLIAAALEERRIATVEAQKKAENERIAEQNKSDKPEVGEKYEEVKTEAGLLPGYYLIANVFGTKKYFDAFMLEMKKKGLEPRAFVRSKNKFNYVYLARFRTIEEARQARDTNLEGKYPDKTWIFRVVGN